MPPISTHRKQWRRFKRRNKGTLATRPRMMGKGLKFKRFNQVSSRVFWFKTNGTIAADLGGNTIAEFTTRGLDSSPPTGWAALKTLYDQYKVLGMKLKLFPANVGVEPDASLFTAGGLIRGDTLVFSDQRYDATATPPTNIVQRINYASARMINTRRPYSRSIYRARGYPEWANIRNPGTLDSWNGMVCVLGNNATAAVPPATGVLLWYYTLQYKVQVRGRVQP